MDNKGGGREAAAVFLAIGIFQRYGYEIAVRLVVNAY